MRQSLAPRLVAAFAAVAVLAVSVLAVLILASARHETSALAQRDQQATRAAVARELTKARGAAQSWATTSFGRAAAVAASADAILVVRDSRGTVVYDSRPAGGPGRQSRGLGGHAISAPLNVAGRTEGTLELRFRGALSRDEQHLRSALGDAVLLGSILAALIAVVVALIVSRRVTRPLARLTAAARRLESGDRSARAAEARAPGELGELAAAFDSMAASIEDQENRRRRLAADLSHELRTPVTIIRGSLEELIEEEEPIASARLAPLNEEVLRLSSLLGELDALAQADLPQSRLDCTEFRVDELAGAIADAVRPHFDAKGVALERRLEPLSIHADRVRIGQVIDNLLSNALKFTPRDGRVELSVERRNGEARIEVTDTGPGIAPSDLPHVFERFWRAADTGGAAGRGLGLSIVADIARAHGGEADASSTPGGGARLRVHLPVD